MKELKRSSFAFMLQAHEDLFGYWLMALAFTLWRKSVQQEKELSLQPKLKDYRMEANEKNTIVTQKWLDGISYEIAFWKNVYRWSHTFRGMMVWANYGSKIELEGFDANSFLLGFEQPKVYDVGCGMSYATGDKIEKDSKLVPLDIHYVDPLAFHFNRILRKSKRDLPQIEFGMAEYLSAFIPSQDASLIIIQNALDHSSAPVKGIIESLLSLHEGGVLYLNHHPNEAEMEKYKGFHQYNVDEQEGQLVIWNKQGSINITQLLDGFASVETKRMDNGHIVAVITKVSQDKQLPVPLRAYVDDRKDKGELCQILLQFQYNNTSLLRGVKNSISYRIFDTIQFFAQMLPWSLKMKVKHWIKQA